MASGFIAAQICKNANRANPDRVRIGILDTGFNFEHQARPQNLLMPLQRNFVDDGRPIDDAASDPFPHGLFTNRGHGTGTIGLLARQRLQNRLVAAH